tara:strand:- start:30154 stop:30351 length:198 start_codon:yes stop_codon:yes gene_type:complete
MFAQISQILKRNVQSFDNISDQDIDTIENNIFSLLNELENNKSENLIDKIIIHNKAYNFLVDNGF